MAGEGRAPAVRRLPHRIDRAVDPFELARDGSVPIGLATPAPVEQPGIDPVLRQGAHGRALRVEVEHARAGREAGDHQHGGAGLPRGGVRRQGRISVEQDRLGFGRHRVVGQHRREFRGRLEGARDARRRRAIVLQPVENGGGGAAPGPIELRARRELPERIVDSPRNLGIAPAGYSVCGVGLQAGDRLHRLAGECTRQAGEIGHRARGRLRMCRRIRPPRRLRQRFDPRAERGRECLADVAEALPYVGIPYGLVGGGEERPHMRRGAGVRLMVRSAPRSTHHAAPDIVICASMACAMPGSWRLRRR